MFKFQLKDRLLARLLAGLMIGVSVVAASLLHAASNAQYTL